MEFTQYQGNNFLCNLSNFISIYFYLKISQIPEILFFTFIPQYSWISRNISYIKIKTVFKKKSGCQLIFPSYFCESTYLNLKHFKKEIWANNPFFFGVQSVSFENMWNISVLTLFIFFIIWKSFYENCSTIGIRHVRTYPYFYWCMYDFGHAFTDKYTHFPPTIFFNFQNFSGSYNFITSKNLLLFI